MTRRSAIAVGALVALASTAVLVALSGLLAADRRRDVDRYDEAIASQRREAGQVAARPDDVRPGARDNTFCATGVDTFMTTLHQTLGTSVVDDDGRLDPAVLRRLSNFATRAERYVEQAHAGPALPQRMGRTRTAGDDGALEWKTIQPLRVPCDGGEAYAAFRIDVRAADQPPADGAPAK